MDLQDVGELANFFERRVSAYQANRTRHHVRIVIEPVGQSRQWTLTPLECSPDLIGCFADYFGERKGGRRRERVG